MSKRPSPITPTVDFNAEGVQHGFLKLPISVDDSAWGAVMVPVTVVKNGDGPTALLTAGNHGDEYEGITALLKLANSLKAEDVQGRVIIVPCFNTPAVTAGKRTSGLDGGNLNRCFPGDPDGSATAQIADYFTREMVPMADAVLDLHSGGRTLDILPYAASHVLDNKEQQAAALHSAKTFGAPYAMVMFELDAAHLFDTVCEDQGKVFVTTELGGGGTSTPKSVEIAERGVRNFLIHHGLTRGEPALPDTPQVYLNMPDASCYVQSEHSGLLELVVSLGERVTQGQAIAYVYDLTRTGTAPAAYHAKRDGLMIARRAPALANIGDTLAVVADVVERFDA